MKRIIALFLALTMILTGCSQTKMSSTEPTNGSATEESSVSEEWLEGQPEFQDLSDENLLLQVENCVYQETIQALNSTEYIVEDVRTVYISKEYLEEVAFNSQANVYFGYTLAELDELFQGSRYIFTLGEDGNTTVRELQTIEDTATEFMIKDVAIGTGVILVCVTVSSVSAAAGAPAISMIFAASATTAKAFAVSSAVFGGISAGVVRGLETGDFEEALEAAELGATEGFKWGAISGAVVGGVTGEVALLKWATENGLTMNEAARIQVESKWPIDVISELHTMKEYEALKKAKLRSTIVGDKKALIKTDIDLTRIDAKGRTNLERMKQGLAPLDKDGISYELHHIGQKKDGTLAVLTRTEHDDSALHRFLQETEAHAAGTKWNAERQKFWKSFAKLVE